MYSREDWTSSNRTLTKFFLIILHFLALDECEVGQLTCWTNVGTSSRASLSLVDQDLQLSHPGPVLAIIPEGLQSINHSQEPTESELSCPQQEDRATNLQRIFQFILGDTWNIQKFCIIFLS